VWEDLADARANNYRYSEDSITETIFLNLGRSRIPGIRFQVFCRGQEGRNGADWEWYFGSSGSWAAFRVQAKRITNRAEVYKGLSHKVAGTGLRQIDLLIQQAGATHTPLYCFYNQWAWLPIMETKCRVQTDASMRKQWGCSIAHARAVRPHVGRGNVPAIRLIPFSLPWQCLVCCKRTPTATESLADTVAANARALSLREDPAPLISQIPSYVFGLDEEPAPKLPAQTVEVRARLILLGEDTVPPDFNLAGAVVVEASDV
jgi:hypothetical protein